MNWRGNTEFEVLLSLSAERGHALSRFIALSHDDTSNSVNDIYKSIILTEVVDNQWLEEMVLRQTLAEKMAALDALKARLSVKIDSLGKLEEEEASLLSQRKAYTSEVSIQGQLLQKRKSRFEDVQHQLNTFSQGVGLVTTNEHHSNVSAVSERMRCVFNELRRVNANIEEKLVIAGVAKQRIMKDIRSIYVDLRSDCSAHSTSKRNHHPIDFDDDPNLSLHKIRDMKSVWRATLPSVPSVSGDPTHADLVTSLSISMGHFAEEIIKDISGTIAAAGQQDNSREEAKLVGVLSVETNRYRCISESLRFAIDDSKKFISDLVQMVDLSTPVEAHLARVLVDASSLVQNRLNCCRVVFWRKLDSTNALGFTCCAQSSPIKAVVADHHEDFAFEQSKNHTFTLKHDETSANFGDIYALKCANLLPPCWELFGVSMKSFGMLVVRDARDTRSFDPFSGIYCEQFFRRVLTAIIPFQVLEVKQVSNQRPLVLIESLFALRCSGNTLGDIVRMSAKHMHDLFRADNFVLNIPLDQVSPETKLVTIGKAANGQSTRVMDLFKKPPRILCQADIEDGFLRIEENPPSDIIEAFKSGQNSVNANGEIRRHVHTVMRGRTVIFVASWTDSFPGETRPKDREEFYNVNAPSHSSTLETYLEMMQASLTPIIAQISSNFDKRDALLSYHVIDEIERNTIKQLLKRA